MTKVCNRILYIHPTPVQLDTEQVVKTESCALVDFVAFALDNSRFDSTILFPKANSLGDVSFTIPPDVNVKLLDLPLNPVSISAAISECFQLPRRIKSFQKLRRMCLNTDCLIIVGYSFSGTIAALLRRPAVDRPTVFLVRGNRLRTAKRSNRSWLRKLILVSRLRVYRWIMRRLIRQNRADAWFQGEENLSETEKSLPPDLHHRLHLLNAVLDDRLIQEFDSSNVTATHHDIVFVGRLVYEKGLFDLIEALRLMRDQNLRPSVNVIGSGPDELLIQNAVKKAGLNDQVHFTGLVSNRIEVLANIKAADVLVLPSHTEGLPRVAAEAMACKTMCVLSAVGGIPFVFTNERDVFLVPPHDPTKLSHALGQAIRLSEEDRDLMTTHAAIAADDLTFSKRALFVESRLQALLVGAGHYHGYN